MNRLRILLAFALAVGPAVAAAKKKGEADATQTPKKTEAPAPAPAREVVQRESHIEFDERLVQGQTAAGAIYLFQRGESEFKSMVKLPESFRDRTVRPLLPNTGAAPAPTTATAATPPPAPAR